MKSVFYYGVMKASKSAQLILKASTYQKQGVEPIIIKPTTDTRDGSGKVHSRIGIEMPVTFTLKHDDIDMVVPITTIARQQNRPIFVDEAQFFSPVFIEKLISVIHNIDDNENSSHVNIFLFGLLKTYNNELFDGTQAILENVDKIEEIKTQCEERGCGRKATCNYLVTMNNADNDIVIGDDKYRVFCQKHYAQHVKEGI